MPENPLPSRPRPLPAILQPPPKDSRRRQAPAPPRVFEPPTPQGPGTSAPQPDNPPAPPPVAFVFPPPPPQQPSGGDSKLSATPLPSPSPPQLLLPPHAPMLTPSQIQHLLSLPPPLPASLLNSPLGPELLRMALAPLPPPVFLPPGPPPLLPRPDGKGEEGEESEAEYVRKGKWTLEEEEYTARIIHYFNLGLLTLPEGQTLRSYISKKLRCDPMRVTKKFTGACCIGKRVQQGSGRRQISEAEVESAAKDLQKLEARFWATLEQSEDSMRNNELLKRTSLLNDSWFSYSQQLLASAASHAAPGSRQSPSPSLVPLAPSPYLFDAKALSSLFPLLPRAHTPASASRSPPLVPFYALGGLGMHALAPPQPPSRSQGHKETQRTGQKRKAAPSSSSSSSSHTQVGGSSSSISRPTMPLPSARPAPPAQASDTSAPRALQLPPRPVQGQEEEAAVMGPPDALFGSAGLSFDSTAFAHLHTLLGHSTGDVAPNGPPILPPSALHSLFATSDSSPHSLGSLGMGSPGSRSMDLSATASLGDLLSSLSPSGQGSSRLTDTDTYSGQHSAASTHLPHPFDLLHHAGTHSLATATSSLASPCPQAPHRQSDEGQGEGEEGDTDALPPKKRHRRAATTPSPATTSDDLSSLGSASVQASDKAGGSGPTNADRGWSVGSDALLTLPLSLSASTLSFSLSSTHGHGAQPDEPHMLHL